MLKNLYIYIYIYITHIFIIYLYCVYLLVHFYFYFYKLIENSCFLFSFSFFILSERKSSCFHISSLYDFDFPVYSFLFHHFFRLSLVSTLRNHSPHPFVLVSDFVAITFKIVTERLI